RLPCDIGRHAIDLKQDAARLDAGGPVFDRSLALAHADFDRLLGHRDVGEHANPHAAGALHLAGDRTAGRFDLTSGHALGLLRLEAELAEGQVRTALGNATDTALVSLAEFSLLRLQHLSDAFSVRRRALALGAAAARRTIA